MYGHSFLKLLLYFQQRTDLLVKKKTHPNQYESNKKENHTH